MALKKTREKRIVRIQCLVKEINELPKYLSFPGIHKKAYLRIKKDEDEFPNPTTPIDEIMKRMKKYGIRVCLGKHPGSGNVFILPADSINMMDSILSGLLNSNNVENEHLRELIRLTTKKR